MSVRGSALWAFRDPTWATGTSIIGYSVEANDGSIGKVDEATEEIGASYIVVDTGPWIFGKKVMLPAGVIAHIDHEDRTVLVSLTKEEIKAAPEFDPDAYREGAYRDSLGIYYQPFLREDVAGVDHR